jgi:putative spermidine/putrescine transport system ATP-binding protein
MTVGIRLSLCSKTFADGTKALQPLDLDVIPGETLAVLGPSGCGKTTALRIIAGLDKPDPGGRVFFDDVDVTQVPIERRNVGMVFQSYALFPNMTVAQNVAYGLKVRGKSSSFITARVSDMLTMTGLETFGHRRIDQLSGGQRQRVALARAIAPEPRILLLDEPLTALDAKLRDRLRVDVDRLLRSLGITAIYVTHDQAEAMALGDRVVIMNKGCIVQIGKPREVYEKPASDFVAGFVGTVNRLEGNALNGVAQVPGGHLPFQTSDGPMAVLFRPEAVKIDPEGSLSGRILSAFFLGDRQRVVVSLTDGHSILADLSTQDDVRVGQDIRIAVTRFIDIN